MWLSGLIITVQYEHCFPWMPVVARLRGLTRQWFTETDSGGTVVLGTFQNELDGPKISSQQLMQS